MNYSGFQASCHNILITSPRHFSRLLSISDTRSGVSCNCLRCWLVLFLRSVAELLPSTTSSQVFCGVCKLVLFCNVKPFKPFATNRVGWLMQWRFWFVFGNSSIRFSVGTPTIQIEAFRGFIIFSSGIPGYYLEICDDRFLPHTFQLIIHYSSSIRRCIMYATDNIVK
jgi:hypothetical protein